MPLSTAELGPRGSVFLRTGDRSPETANVTLTTKLLGNSQLRQNTVSGILDTLRAFRRVTAIHRDEQGILFSLSLSDVPARQRNAFVQQLLADIVQAMTAAFTPIVTVRAMPGGSSDRRYVHTGGRVGVH